MARGIIACVRHTLCVAVFFPSFVFFSSILSWCEPRLLFAPSLCAAAVGPLRIRSFYEPPTMIWLPRPGTHFAIMIKVGFILILRERNSNKSPRLGE